MINLTQTHMDEIGFPPVPELSTLHIKRSLLMMSKPNTQPMKNQDPLHKNSLPPY